MHAPLRLRLDSAALVHNWRTLGQRSGPAACGAAVKANGYGLGAREVVGRLVEAGCRDFFVATWAEAEAVADIAPAVSVLHGLREEDLPQARRWPHIRPVLNTPVQIARWRDSGGGPCDVMVDTGMNRLGVRWDAPTALFEGLEIHTLLSHLACADEDHPLNAEQHARFAEVAARVPAKRTSLANSAGIFLGQEFRFDLTRPGLALYGGVPCPAAEGVIRQVVHPEAQVLQRRRMRAGETAGYNATYVAQADQELAVLNIGYADGYGRGFSDTGTVFAGDVACPVRGRVSMDLLIVDVTGADVAEGDWLSIDYALPRASAASGRSQYELLTGLGRRFDRVWR
ncbi:alanine racemase [Sphingomonas sp. PL-96]|uniref:alanine racemase n=1 Tax=Sphingomonas sp. PL-96 TaxID=2887201 RepID=UPI001E529573|nr:alanine racemase [Sphingomonas sp. PL-96]MCC2975085.1 alanine racemase [Sphingomonas sp. PL-96]